MKRFVKYAVWNLMITGTLVAGYLFNEMRMCGIIVGVLYSVMIPLYILAIFLFRYSHELSDAIGTPVDQILPKRSVFDFKVWHLLEPVFVWLAIFMGFPDRDWETK